MTHKHHLDRSALTAIAAVLAFSATPSLAQDTAVQPSAPATGDVSPSTPPVASPPVVADAPVAPSTAAPAPASPATTAAPVTLPPIDATPPVPQAAPVTSAAPALPQIATTPAPQTVQSIPANAEPEPQGPAERAAPVAERRAAQAERAPAAPVAEQRAAAPAKPATNAAPVEPVTPAEAVATPEQAPAPAAAPAQAEASADDGSNPALWALGAGGVLAVAGLGFMMLRSRRRPEITYAGEVVTEMPPRVEPEIPVAAATVYAPQAPLTAAPTLAAVAATPRATATRRAAVTTGEASSLEAMVAEAPSAANPFLTRRNRMRRAKFILAHGEAPVATTGNRQYPELAAAKQGVGNAAIKPARVYDFGKATTTRWPNWKPATS